MGQKLVSIKFNAGSASNLWNLEYNPNFLVQISGSGDSAWSQQLEYCPEITDTINFPVNVKKKEQITDSVVRKLIQKNQRIAFMVDDEITSWQVQMKDTILTDGEWEILARGTF